jgi:hypothetical protein
VLLFVFVLSSSTAYLAKTYSVGRVTLTALVVAIASFVLLLGGLPGSIARGRGHPNAYAITICGWLGLIFTGGVAWFVALIWALTNTMSDSSLANPQAQATLPAPTPAEEPAEKPTFLDARPSRYAPPSERPMANDEILAALAPHGTADPHAQTPVVQTLPCPTCGNPLTVRPGERIVKCGNCGDTFSAKLGQRKPGAV